MFFWEFYFNVYNKTNINEDSKIYNHKDLNAYNNNIGELLNRKKEKKLLFNSHKEFNKKNYNAKTDKSLNKLVDVTERKKRKNKKLFPFKYYLYTVFVKNVNKNSSIFSKKFIEVYQFICQLMDISSYIILQREFQILKNTLMIGEHRDIVENSKKINVNEKSFNDEMKECLETKKLTILGRIRNIE